MAFHGAVELPPEGYPFGQVKPSRKKTEVGSDRAGPWSSSGPCDRGWNRTRPLGHHGAPRSSPNGSARTRGGESNERTFATPSPEPCWFKGVRRIRKFGTWALVWFTYVFGVFWVFRTTPSQASTYVRCKQCAQVYHAYGVRTGGVQFRSRRSYAQVYHAYVCYQLCVQRHLCALSSFHCLRFVQITNNRQRHTYVRHNDRKHQRCDQHVLDVFLSFLTSSEIRFLPVPFTYYVSQLRTYVCTQKLRKPIW